MTAYQVKLHAITDMTAFVEVEADSPAAALDIAKARAGADAYASAEWEFVDARDAMDVRAVEVWDADQRGVIYPPDLGDVILAVINEQVPDGVIDDLGGLVNELAERIAAVQS